MTRSRFRFQPCCLALGLAMALATAACGDDDGDQCTDPCEQPDAIRCFGTFIQRCESAPDGCQVWTDETNCDAQGLICLSPVSGPECGTLCTNQCSSGQSVCSGEMWQTCEANQWGCMLWEDFMQCDATSLVCDDSSGDASCFAP